MIPCGATSCQAVEDSARESTTSQRPQSVLEVKSKLFVFLFCNVYEVFSRNVLTFCSYNWVIKDGSFSIQLCLLDPIWMPESYFDVAKCAHGSHAVNDATFCAGQPHG